MPSHGFEHTGLWKTTLAARDGDEDAASRERLRTAFLNFRQRVALLAAEIHRDLPDYTVHDITHLDALWEMGDIIVGNEYQLTPTEAFAFGGAVLLHDLGMGLAAYPEGLEELKSEPAWADIVTGLFERRLDSFPTAYDIENPPEEIKREAVGVLLRNLHARQAERLAFISWKARGDDVRQYLIEDSEIRQTFGRTIGLIAHSHWWPVNKLEQEFPRTLGAPHWCPNGWTLDPLKLACLLRVADISHIDARRAPSFLRALRRPSNYSDEHWKFQEKLQKPHLAEDSLAFTSGNAFPLSAASSWWLCLDTLKAIDEELRHVDALLADRGIPRFTARRVAGVDSPERLVAYVPTDGWLPVNAFIQVSDVPKLVTNLGGSELYGRNVSVPVREMLQNAADAVRARRVVESRPSEWGTIRIELGKDKIGHWLEVEDSGIGMSAEVLTKYLLDFGSTYWGSNLMVEEFPGLLASGIRLTGKYGIGFFSLFMLGNAIRIRTRRSDAAQTDTLVLEFNTGISSRPIIRNANHDERIREGGTTVRLWLDTAPSEVGGLLRPYTTDHTRSLAALCRQIAPALDVDLLIIEDGNQTHMRANEWMSSTSKDFVENLLIAIKSKFAHEEYDTWSIQTMEKLASNVKEIRDEHGVVVGRACAYRETYRTSGFVSVGGFYSCSLAGIFGILTGKSERAARDHARPDVSGTALAAWASEQAKLIKNLFEDPERQVACAEVIRRCGGDVGDLAITRFRGNWMTQRQLGRLTSLPNELLFLNDYYISNVEKLSGFSLLPNVFVTSIGSWMSILQSSGDAFTFWPDELFQEGGVVSYENTLTGAVIEAISEVWGVESAPLIKAFGKSSNRMREKIVAYINEEPIRFPVYVLRKPAKRRGSEVA